MTAVPTRIPRVPTGFPAFVLSVALVTLACFGLLALGNALRHPAPESIPVPINPAIEAKWGIRVTQVAATADGGLVDFRFVALDPDKAAEMMSSVDNLPVLVPDGSTTVINSAAQMGTPHTLRAGETYFFLYRDESGVIARGTSLSVVFGDLKIEHVIAR